MTTNAGDTPEGRELLRRFFRHQDEKFIKPAAEQAKLYRDLLTDKAKRKSHLRITYRGRNCRCQLLHVFSTPRGVLLGYPPRPAGSEAQGGEPGYVIGREAQKASAYWLPKHGGDTAAPDVLRCRHVIIDDLSCGEIRDDLAGIRHAGHKTIPLPRGDSR